MTAISVIMSVYNADSYVKETINSVLSQSFQDFEFLIINDGSTDQTENIILEYNDNRIVYLFKVNEGLSKALNFGLKLAKGKYIARIDADDICKTDRLLKQYNFLENNPTYLLCGSTTDVIDEKSNFIYTYNNLPLNSYDIKQEMEYKNCIIHSTAFFLRETAIKLGGYYEPIKQYFEDYMLFYKFSQIGDVYNFSEPLIEYRLTPGSITTRVKNKKYEQLVLKVVKRGYITNNEKSYLFKYKSNKSNKFLQYSNHYLALSRLYLLHQRNYFKSIEYFKKAILIYPFNSNSALTFFYLFYQSILLYFKKRHDNN